jgi:hypothetical protein
MDRGDRYDHRITDLTGGGDESLGLNIKTIEVDTEQPDSAEVAFTAPKTSAQRFDTGGARRCCRRPDPDPEVTMEIIGRCRLCLDERSLRNSHFIPQAAYKLVRGKGKNPHPLLVRADTVIQTSAQTRAHLLCDVCEQRLCKSGEDAFFRNCYRGPGKFRLLQMLREGTPVFEDDEAAIYIIPDSEQSTIYGIGYMGLSVLWKAAAHRWRDQDGTITPVSLGSPYQEQVRQFLLGEGPFPEHASMVVEVSDENNRFVAVVGTPASSKFPKNYLHWIDICGIRFNLLMGSRMAPHLKELSVFRLGQKCVLVAKRQEARLATDYRQSLTVLARGNRR